MYLIDKIDVNTIDNEHIVPDKLLKLLTNKV